MDVQAAGICHVGAVSHANRLLQYILPVHTAHVVIQCGRMRHNLEPIIKTAVRFTVNMFTPDIGLLLNAGSTFIILSRAVDFQLDAEITVPVSVKDRLGFV